MKADCTLTDLSHQLSKKHKMRKIKFLHVASACCGYISKLCTIFYPSLRKALQYVQVTHLFSLYHLQLLSFAAWPRKTISKPEIPLRKHYNPSEITTHLARPIFTGNLTDPSEDVGKKRTEHNHSDFFLSSNVALFGTMFYQ